MTVVERADVVGGKLRRQRAGTESIDAGPTVFTMKWVFDQIFADAGGALEEQISLTRAEILARHFWNGGASLDLFADSEKSAAAIESFSSHLEAARYLDFCRRTEDVFDMLKEPFLKASKPGLLSLIVSSNPAALWQMQPFSSLWDVLSAQFEDPRLRQLFGRYATYCGASPFLAPATLSLIAHVERSGVWSIEGGMKQLAIALESLAKRNGANFIYGSEVDRIVLKNRRVTGVAVRGSGEMPADIVICNADVAALNSGLLGPDVEDPAAARRTRARSQSAMTWTMQARAEGPPLSEHNVFFSEDYRAEFDAVFDQGETPKSPTVYLHAPATDDADQRPIFCLTNAPPNGGRGWYDEEETERCWMRMVTQLEQCGLKLDPTSATVISTTPDDYAARFPGTNGALYGAPSHGWQATFQRPGVRTRKRGLYLAGGSVHPGPGVPMAALSGQAAAMAAISDFNLTAMSPQAVMPGGT